MCQLEMKNMLAVIATVDMLYLSTIATLCAFDFRPVKYSWMLDILSDFADTRPKLVLS